MLQSDPSWTKQSEIYSRLEKEAIQSFLKALAPLIVGYLIATSLRSENEIGLIIYSLEIFVPASYFLFFVSFALLNAAVSFNHLVTAMSAKTSIAGKIRIPGFSVTAYDVLNNRSENGLGIPNHLSLFHKEVLPVQNLLQILFVLILFSVLLPLCALGYFLLSEQVSLTMDSEVRLLERLSASVGVLSTVSAAFFIIFFHIPLPITKNKAAIRWNFLYWLPQHPTDDGKFKRWISESK